MNRRNFVGTMVAAMAYAVASKADTVTNLAEGAPDGQSLVPVKLQGVAEHNDGNVFVLEKNGVRLELNATGTLVWNSIGGNKTALEIEQIICQTWGIDAADAKRDVSLFLSKLEKSGFIRLNTVAKYFSRSSVVYKKK